MRLLIITQAVDRADPVLGFFHRWIEEFAARCEQVHVICLKEGEHALPSNVMVHSLGKESGHGRFTYLVRFYRYIWSLRGEYEAVFVHMNQEYVLLGGLLWRLLRKRVVLWRNHAQGSRMTRLTCALSVAVCYTSTDAFVAHCNNSVRMPVGIDTAQFNVSRETVRGTVLSLGRLDPVKRVRDMLAAIKELADSAVDITFDLYGAPTPGREVYAEALRAEFSSLEKKGLVSFQGAVRHDQTPRIYARHDIFLNLTPDGSLDKTIFEAMAAGCLVITSNQSLSQVVRPELFVGPGIGVATAIQHALSMTGEDALRERVRLRRFVEEHHSLAAAVRRVIGLLAASAPQNRS